ncbi:Hypothetical predicted protein, partial [Pelobates cultripes]
MRVWISRLIEGITAGVKSESLLDSTKEVELSTNIQSFIGYHITGVKENSYESLIKESAFALLMENYLWIQ